jgi:hypothetical protein
MEKRVCKHCKKEYPIEYFERANTVKGKVYRRWSCKDCRKIEKHDIAQRKKEWFISVKEKLSCKVCGENKIYLLDFHHKDPNKKEGNLGTLMWSWGKKRILKEIEKCDVYCANHHRELHYMERKQIE